MKIDLKAYTSRVKDLEVAIYTEKKLMNLHENLIDNMRPNKPVKATVTAPVKPTPNYDFEKPSKPGEGTALFISGLCVITGIFGIVGLFIAGFAIPVIICLAFGALGSIVLIGQVLENKDYKENVQMRKEMYNKAVEEYPRLIEEYNYNVSVAEKEYQLKIQEYEQELDRFNNEYKNTMNKHNLALSSLETALNEVYNEDIIFPKYRNIVAISSINEYILSGRCNELEGPNGAYNLYEMELRQNIIIGKLSTIIDNLEQIRNNQYSLYEELCKSNATIEDIIFELRDLKKDTKLLAYFSSVTALAETSPKFYYTVTI